MGPVQLRFADCSDLRGHRFSGACHRKDDDLHRLLLLDLVEITALGVIALLGTDLAEALVLPGLTVGIAELLALSQIYSPRKGLKEMPVRGLEH